MSVDEWDSDPEDPADPSHCYEQAALLQPSQYKTNGQRVRPIEPMTPEREELERKEVRKRRQQLLVDLKEGKKTVNYGEAG